LCELGNNEELHDIEEFIMDEVNYKLNFEKYKNI
jgi:hypothetical protein